MPATARPHQRVFLLDHERWELADRDLLREMRRVRAWERQIVPAQEAEWEPFEIRPNFLLGSGIYETPGNAGYWYADGWTADAAGVLRTYGPHAALEAGPYTSTRRGWMLQLGAYVYVLRGQYAVKYAMDDTGGNEWEIVEFHNFGDGIAVGGRPATFRGRVYVARYDEEAAEEAIFHRLSVPNPPVVGEQTLTMSGSPSGGTFTLSFDDGVSDTETDPIAFDAPAADVQAALRAIPGLQKVTVVRSGAAPNFTWTVTMTAAPTGEGTAAVPELTADSSGLTGGSSPHVTPATTTAGEGDRWDEGPATITARCFKPWRRRLVRAFEDNVSLVSADPMEAGDWGTPYSVGESGLPVTDLALFADFLMAGKPDGLFSFDESTETVNELEDLSAVVDEDNCVGMEMAQGFLLVPHAAGLIRWRPGSFRIIGSEQDGLAQGDDPLSTDTRAGGWTRGIAPYGRQVYYVSGFRETSPEQTTVLPHLGVMSPGEGRASPYIPHTLRYDPASALEDARVVTSLAGIPYLVTLGVQTEVETRPRAYRLPRNGQPNGRDADVVREPGGEAQFQTPYYRQRDSTVRNIYEHVMIDVSEIAAALAVGWEIDNLTSNAFDAVDAPGVHRLAFPTSLTDQDSDAPRAGGPIRLTLTAGGAVSLRDIRIRGYRVPMASEQFTAVLILRDGQLPDGTQRRMTAQEQAAHLRSLMRDPNLITTPSLSSLPVGLRDPDTGEFARAHLTGLTLGDWNAREHEPPVKVATVSGRIVRYEVAS